jgi:hypothetical protein
MHAQNFASFATAADVYYNYNVGAMVGAMTPRNPTMGALWTNSWELVTTAGHMASGKALRMYFGKNFYGDPGGIDNQWWGFPLNGNGNNIAGAFTTHFFIQMTIWTDSFINYYWKLGDGSLGGTKFFGLDQYNGLSAGDHGEVVITNQYNLGFVTGYDQTTGSRDWARGQVTPGNNSNYAIQPAIDRGTALDSTDASYFRRYGPFYYGMYGALNQASLLSAQGVPNVNAAIGGIAWNRGGKTVIEVECDYPNRRLRCWAAHHGNAPTLLFDSGPGGAFNYSMTFPNGEGWSGVTLTNLIYTATGAQNPGYPADAYTDYSEMIISSNPINFPGGFTLP